MSKVKKAFVFRNQMVLLLSAVLLVGAVLWLQYQHTRQETPKATMPVKIEMQTQAVTTGQEISPQMQPAPAAHGTAQEGAVESEAKDHWGGPLTRDKDLYGPPPGWVAPTPYGPEGHQPATNSAQEQNTTESVESSTSISDQQ